jgi:hypothetical protein
MERRIQRSLPHRQNVARQQLNALRDAPPVKRLARDGLENQEIKRALQQIGWLRHDDTSMVDNHTSTIDNSQCVVRQPLWRRRLELNPGRVHVYDRRA